MFRAVSIADLTCTPLNVFEAFVEELRVPAIETDVVLLMWFST